MITSNKNKKQLYTFLFNLVGLPPASSSRLISLPKDLMLAVLSYLMADELCAIAPTSKSMKQLSENDWLWQKMFERRGHSFVGNVEWQPFSRHFFKKAS